MNISNGIENCRMDSSQYCWRSTLPLLLLKIFSKVIESPDQKPAVHQALLLWSVHAWWKRNQIIYTTSSCESAEKTNKQTARGSIYKIRKFFKTDTILSNVLVISTLYFFDCFRVLLSHIWRIFFVSVFYYFYFSMNYFLGKR